MPKLTRSLISVFGPQKYLTSIVQLREKQASNFTIQNSLQISRT